MLITKYPKKMEKKKVKIEYSNFVSICFSVSLASIFVCEDTTHIAMYSAERRFVHSTAQKHKILTLYANDVTGDKKKTNKSAKCEVKEYKT